MVLTTYFSYLVSCTCEPLLILYKTRITRIKQLNFKLNLLCSSLFSVKFEDHESTSIICTENVKYYHCHIFMFSFKIGFRTPNTQFLFCKGSLIHYSSMTFRSWVKTASNCANNHYFSYSIATNEKLSLCS